MERPEDLFDRESEWEELASFARQPGQGARLALVRGRRRQGKSFLLRRLVERMGGFYYQALPEERAQALRGFQRALEGLVSAPTAVEDWEEAFGALDQLADDGPALVIMDGFPFLLEHSPQLVPVLERALDRPGGPPLRIVLCGSPDMAPWGSSDEAVALRDRATTEVVLSPFDYRTAAAYWDLAEGDLAFRVHAVIGGSAGYRNLLPWMRTDGFDSWLERGVLNPASAVFGDHEHLPTEARGTSERVLLHSVVGAVAGGASSPSQIASALSLPARAIQRPLEDLVEAGIISRSEDAFRSEQPTYRVAEPVVRFHHVVTRLDLARFEERRTAEAWEDAQDRFRRHVLGPHLEELARQFLIRYARSETTGGRPAQVLPAMIHDSDPDLLHELTAVVLGEDSQVLALAAAPYCGSPVDLAWLTRLEATRDLLGRHEPTAVGAKLIVFAASGFEPDLERAAVRSDVELVGLARLYRGH